MGADAVVAVVVVERVGAAVARWTVPRGGTTVDLGHVHAVARLVLAARALGGCARLEGADPRLVELLALAGLRRQVLGQTEPGEDAAGQLEEVVVADDPLG